MDDGFLLRRREVRNVAILPVVLRVDGLDIDGIIAVASIHVLFLFVRMGEMSHLRGWVWEFYGRIRRGDASDVREK